MSFFQKDIETMPRAELEKLQLEKLKHITKYCYDNVPLYKRKFDEAGFDCTKIKALSDIQYIPYTTKSDFRDNYPFGMFATPLKNVTRLHASSGTTGKPTVVGYTKNDLDMWSDCVARLVTAAGATDEDIVQIAFGYGLFTGALGLHYGLEKIGATVVPCSSGNTEKQVMLMKDFGTTALVATPSYAMRIGEVAEEMGIGRDELKLRLGLFGSEGCTPEMRAQIEDYLHLLATDNYGMSELMGPGVSGECSLRCGMHFNEDHFLPEIINSETGEVLPEGSKGELVFTSITKEAFPLLRYRTRDICILTREKCSCGRTLVKMCKPMGRSDDMLIIKGVNVFPSQIESVLLKISKASPNYQIVVDRVNNSDTFEIRVELNDDMFSDTVKSIEDLEKKISNDIHNILGIKAKIRLVEPKSIPRSEGKAVRVIDKRKLV